MTQPLSISPFQTWERGDQAGWLLATPGDGLDNIRASHFSLRLSETTLYYQHWNTSMIRGQSSNPNKNPECTLLRMLDSFVKSRLLNKINSSYIRLLEDQSLLELLPCSGQCTYYLRESLFRRYIVWPLTKLLLTCTTDKPRTKFDFQYHNLTELHCCTARVQRDITGLSCSVCGICRIIWRDKLETRETDIILAL